MIFHCTKKNYPLINEFRGKFTQFYFTLKKVSKQICHRFETTIHQTQKCTHVTEYVDQKSRGLLPNMVPTFYIFFGPRPRKRDSSLFRSRFRIVLHLVCNNTMHFHICIDLLSIFYLLTWTVIDSDVF